MFYEKCDPDVADHQYRDSFNLLFNQIQDCTFIMDKKGGIIQANKAAMEKLEYTREEMLSMNIDQLHPLTRREEVEELVKRMSVVDLFKVSIPLCTKYGNQITVETRVFKGTWEGNDVLYGISKEVTIGASNTSKEQVPLEMELAKQRRYFKTVLDTIPDYIFVKDTNGAYLGCNKADAEKYFGRSEDEVRGKTDFDLFNDIKQAEFYREQDRETFEACHPIMFEDKYILTDGSAIDTETVKTPFFDEQGNIAGLIGIARDITNRKRLEKQLREHADYSESLFRTVPSAVLSVDRQGKIIRWNKIAEQITGYTEAEVMGKECSRVLHGVGRDRCGLCLKAIDLPLINETCNILTKNGQVRHVIKSVAILKDEFYEISEKMECFEDITSLIDMEADLRESKERYAAIVNSAPQIVVIHTKGIIKFVNEVGRDVLGYKEDEGIGQHFKGFMTEDSLTRVNLAMLDNSKGKTSPPYELELIKKSGQIINVLSKSANITFKREKASLAVMIDITENKQLNTKLRASEEKFRQVAETINEIFLIADKERIVYVSPAYERITGMPGQTMLDNPHALAELIYPLDRKIMGATFPQKFLSINQATSVEFRIIRPDGKMRWLWLQSYPIRGEPNNSTLKATTIVDITDRKEIEDKLHEQERQNQMELSLAERVQRDSLPFPYAGKKVLVSTIFEPYSMVSGDFFNFKWFEKQNKLCGYIIDVSGHGVATALQTATFKMMLDIVLLTGKTVEERHLQTINQRIQHYLYEDSFVALLYFEFDLVAKVLKLISAGITLFLAAKPDECSLVPISGCYLGIVDDPEIETLTIPIKSGEIYCMMSDGASDLIESEGISKWGSITEYTNWFEKLAESPDRSDDFSVICIEILPENTETIMLDVKNDKDLERAQVKISEFLERNAPSHALMLEVAINEAINNGLYAGGRVGVKLTRSGGKLIIRVKDDGPGFNTKEVNPPHEEPYDEAFDELLEAEGGRGVLLMRTFCDKVIYNVKGNEVLLMKKL